MLQRGHFKINLNLTLEISSPVYILSNVHFQSRPVCCKIIFMNWIGHLQIISSFCCPDTVGQCFSVRNGLSTLVQTQRHISGVDFSSFDGIHAVTSFFIVFGHRYIAMLHLMAVTNYSAIENVSSSNKQIIINNLIQPLN